MIICPNCAYRYGAELLWTCRKCNQGLRHEYNFEVRIRAQEELARPVPVMAPNSDQSALLDAVGSVTGMISAADTVGEEYGEELAHRLFKLRKVCASMFGS